MTIIIFKNIILFSLIFFGIESLSAQDLPPNPKTGKCYAKCTELNGKKDWIEIPCDSAKNYSKKHKLKIEREQQKLLNLGYDIEVTGCVDTKTIEAYKNNLEKEKKIKKAERKAKRKLRKAKK